MAKDKDLFWKIATGVLIVVLVAILVNNNQGGTTDTAAAPAADTGEEQFPIVTVDMKQLIDDDAVLGKASAPITIVEFIDYECPYCGRHFTQTHPSIKTQYVDTGKVKIVVRDFPLSFHAQAQKAAEAAECAGEQGKYYEMHDKIFQNQALLGIPSFKLWAEQLGLNTEEFDTCLDTGKMADEIKKDMADGSAVGIRGTPGFVIGKSGGNSAMLISGAYPFEAFQYVIEAQLS